MFIDNNLNKQCQDLKDLIDEKLYILSSKELMSLKAGTCKTNFQDFQALVDYKNILDWYRYGSDCFCDVDLDCLTSLIRKRLNSSCS